VSVSEETERPETSSVASRPGREIAGRVAQIALFVGIVVGVFAVVLPRVTDLGDVWAIIRSMSLTHYLLLACATVWNVVTYWPVVVAGLPGLTYPQAAVVNQSSTSVAMIVPGGGAIAVGVSYAMFRSWGFRRSQIALSALVTGISNVFMKLALPAVALALLAVKHDDSPGLVSAAVIGVTVLLGATVTLTLVLWSDAFARRIGSLFGKVLATVPFLVRRGPGRAWGDMAVVFRTQMLELLRDRWPFLVGSTVISHLSVFLVLLLSLRFVGVSVHQVSTLRVFAVFALVRLASSVPIVPGNVGLAELGYVAGLVLAGGDRPAVVAAVLVFRFLTYYAQIPLGAVTYLIWRRNRTWRKAPIQDR